MLMPRLFTDDLFDLMDDFDRHPVFGKHEKNWMKTDVKEVEGGYELMIDLPGFKKEEVKVVLDRGMLTISAEKNVTVDDKDDKGNYIRQERSYGACSRSFYVGEDVKHEDIKGRFEDGVLRLDVAKVDKKEVENRKFISIE